MRSCPTAGRGSSTTSSRTSTSWSTSDPAVRPGNRRLLSGLIRLSHPFPSLLNALATAGIALLAGGDPGSALRLGVSMLCLQASIGAVNDLADADADRVGKPAKPIPAGVVARPLARAWALAALVLGLVAAATLGASVALVAAAGVSLGYMYDLRLSRTALSWLPLALALPLVPIFAWLGATGTTAAGLVTLVPIAVLAGAALLIANGLVDVERDAEAGKPTTAVRLGKRPAWLAHAGAFAIAIVLAVVLAPAAPAPGVAGAEARPELRPLFLAGIPLGVALILAGASLLASAEARVRERGWELEAIGTAALGIGWLAGTAMVGGGAGA